MIQLNEVSKTIMGTKLIADCSLTVNAGETVCICGPSGIGKTTLLEIAAGLSSTDSGSVTLGSQSIGCAFQDDVLVPWLSALDNLILVLPEKIDDAISIAATWLDRFGIEPDQKPPTMSGGMRRRLSLARAFAVNPQVLLLDEPFAFLDNDWQAKTAKYIEQHRAKNNAVLLVSHQEEHLSKISCRTVSITHGPIAFNA